MRVVQDTAGGAAAGRRRADPTTIDAAPGSFEVVGGAGTAIAAGSAPKAGLPLLPAGLFLLACAAGGVLVAVVRPLGLG